MNNEIRPEWELIDLSAPKSDLGPSSQVYGWGAIVIAAIILLGISAILFPAFQKACACGSTKVQCAANEHEILGALFDYASRHNGYLPPSIEAIQSSDPELLSKPSRDIFHCPVGRGAYVYLGEGRRKADLANDVVLIYEPPTNHTDPKSGKGSMMVAYASGSVLQVVQPQADKIIAELKAGQNPPRQEMIK